MEQVKLTREQFLLATLTEALINSSHLSTQAMLHGPNAKAQGHALTFAQRLEYELTEVDAVRGMLQRADVLDRTWPKDHEAATYDKRMRTEKAMKDAGVTE